MIQALIGVLVFLSSLCVMSLFSVNHPSSLMKSDVWLSSAASESAAKGAALLSVPLPLRVQRRVRNILSSAGLQFKPGEAIALWFGFFILVSISGLIVRGSAGFLAGGLVGVFLPILLLRRMMDSRMQKLEHQLPVLMDLLASGLRAGFSLMQALQHSGGQLDAPLGPSIEAVVSDITMGLDVETALGRWIERTGSDDLEMVVTAILVQREVGGNLAEILENIAGLLRDRQDAAMEMRTLTAQGRLEGAIISLLPVALALAIHLMNPGYMDPLVTTPLGKVILSAAVVSAGIGIFLVQRIVKPKF